MPPPKLSFLFINVCQWYSIILNIIFMLIFVCPTLVALALFFYFVVWRKDCRFYFLWSLYIFPVVSSRDHDKIQPAASPKLLITMVICTKLLLHLSKERNKLTMTLSHNPTRYTRFYRTEYLHETPK